MSVRILINGARGRMGSALISAAAAAKISVSAAIDTGDDLAGALAGCDVVVDFSSALATQALLRAVIAQGKPIVIGTTGHSPALKSELVILARQVPCVWAGNFSVGVNLLFALTQRATRILGADYDAEIIEMHHRFKQDAPSGTAARLLEIIMKERQLEPSDVRHGREGLVGERTPREVGVHSLRGGDVVGDHTVIFSTLGERVELTHRASDRGIFARGALRAAEWVVTRPPGIYDMQDVLGLRE